MEKIKKIKRLVPLLLVVLLVTTITAGTIILSALTNVEVPAVKGSVRPFEGNLTCDCNEQKNINCGKISESEIDQEDLKNAVSDICEGTQAINIKFEGSLIKQNEFGDMDTDESKLNELTCIKTNGDWINGICNEKPETICLNEGNLWNGTACEEIVNEIIEESNQYYCVDKDIYLECPFGISGGIGTRCYKTEELNSWFYCSSGWTQ